jgi:hypothetical protein
LAWPVAPFSQAQIAAAKNCNIEDVITERYPAKLPAAALADAFEPLDACDWAVLVAAYAERQQGEEPAPDAARGAWAEVAAQNPALLFAPRLFFAQSWAAPLVAAPPVAQQPVTGLDIDYTWSGLGDPVAYSIRIRNGDHVPEVTVTARAGVTTTPPVTIATSLVQAVGAALTDFLPVTGSVALAPCLDNMPDWQMEITLADGSTLPLQTHASNFYYLGGPWQLRLGGQTYLQYSAALPNALADLLQAIKLPVGEPAGMYCHEIDPLAQAFP